MRRLPLALAALLLVTACGGSSTHTADARAEVVRLLTAEQRGDHDASHRVLAPGTDVDDWARQREALPPVTGFRVTKVSGSTVEVVVRHHAGLDPFVGLAPGRDREVWRVADGGVEPDPTIEPLLPSPTTAVVAARTWATAIQRCDATAALTEQVGPDLLGTSAAAGALCHADELHVGQVHRTPAGPATSDLVAQYGADALGWTRTVTVNDAGVVLAPIGDRWKVVGIFDT